MFNCGEHTHLKPRERVHAGIVTCLAALMCTAALAGCTQAASATVSNVPSAQAENSEQSLTQDDFAPIDEPNLYRVYVPLSWDINNTYLVEGQGSTQYWGACGECAIANTLNLVTGSTYSEADIVNFVVANGLCDPASGGMTTVNMGTAYKMLLPLDTMDMYWYCDEEELTVEQIASKIEQGIILNVSVSGEMLRTGGYASEGQMDADHWIVVHSVYRNEDGTLAGFGILDSASDIRYLTAQELANVYYGNDETEVLSRVVIQIFGWKYLIVSDG